MRKLNCLIADDEPIARQILEGYIKNIPNLKLISSCKNAFEVINVLQNKSIDLLFLDINMPKLSGISLLKSLQEKPEVIITTAYPEYAIEGFELSVTDYLLKPFSIERFLQAILKVHHNLQENMTNPPEKNQKYIFVKSDKKLLKLNFDDVYYIEAYGNYIKIFTSEMILTPQTLSNFHKKLSNNFIRIHKSYIINFKYLKLIEGGQIILKNNKKLPIGKQYRKGLLDKI